MKIRNALILTGKGLLMSLLLSLSPNVAAQVIGLNMTYKLSFEQLDRFWQSNVGHPSDQDGEAYRLLAQDILRISSSQFTEAEGSVAARITGNNSSLYIPVVRQDKRYSRLAERLAKASHYIQKTGLFTGTLTDPGQPGILSERLYAAQLESFLGYVWQFATARSLTLKCQAITRSIGLSQAVEGARSGNFRLTSEDRFLLDLYDQIRGGQDSSFLTRMRDVTCAAHEVTTRKATVDRIKQRVADRLLVLSQEDGGAPLLSGFAATKKMDFEPLLTAYKTMNDQMQSPDFNMMASELRAMRDAIENIKSSFQLIKEDTYCLDRGTAALCPQMLMTRLRGINFDQFLRFGDSKDPVVLQTKYYNENIGVQGGLKSILAGYAGIGKSAQNPQGATTCADVVAKFSVTESAVVDGQTNDANTLRAAFRTAMTSCLGEAMQLYDRIAKENGRQFAIDDTFAKNVMNLSDAILKYKKQE